MMNLKNFQDELERGCIYKAKANIPHSSFYSGIIEAPHYPEYVKGRVMYRTIPIHAIKSKTFHIKKGEIGDLVDLGLSEEEITFFRIQWKSAIQIYYRNPVTIKNRKRQVPLEKLFAITKIEPKKKRI